MALVFGHPLRLSFPSCEVGPGLEEGPEHQPQQPSCSGTLEHPMARTMHPSSEFVDASHGAVLRSTFWILALVWPLSS